MNTEQIIIPVDSDIAEAYRSASDERRRKYNILLNLRLGEITRSTETLESIMDRVSQNAMKRGLTSEILEEILNEV